MRVAWLPILVLAACQQEAEPLPPLLVVSPTSIDFGALTVGLDETAQISIANEGEGVIVPMSAAVVSGSGGIFRVVRDDIEAIGPFDFATVDVTFVPPDEGDYFATIHIETDFSSEATEVEVRGAGARPEMDRDGDGYTELEGDCDDANPAVHPGAEETCSGVDDDCDGFTLSGETDDDLDGMMGCEGDCDDDDPTIYDDAPELCDGLDNNCDGIVADHDDQDGDGWSACDGDCDDARADVHPDAAELCDGRDNDCDGNVSPGERDDDGDGWRICLGDCNDDDAAVRPDALEQCDDVDWDCSGIPDDLDVDEDGSFACTTDCNDNDAAAYGVVATPGGDPAGAGGDLDPVDSIAGALALLDASCRTVYLGRGVFTDVAEVWPAGRVTLIGGTGIAADVELQAAPGARHFDVQGELTLRHLSLRGGAPGGPGGAIQAMDATLTLDNVTVVASTAVGAGGGVYATGGTVHISDSGLRNNTADEGGGLALEGAGSYTVERVQLVLNDAAGQGGGVALRDVAGAGNVLRNLRVQDNRAVGGGGGIAVLGTGAAIEVANNTLSGNESSSGEGAAILVDATGAGSLVVTAQVVQSADGASAVWALPGSGAQLDHVTVFATLGGIDFGGEVGDGYGAPVDPTNVVRDPLLVFYSNNGDPDDDDLGLDVGSPEIDDGPPDPAYDDLDGTRNDRGFTGGPGA